MADNARRNLERLKVFAMTAQLIESDLDRVERDNDLDLGRGRDSESDRDEDYYPQFDEAVRREASEMARHYEVFYCLEKAIRKLIADTFEAAEPGSWWDGGRVPKAIHEEVAQRMQKEIDSAVTVRSTAPLDYTTFGELGEIIKANWDLFGGILRSRRAVEKVMANLNTLRGPIAHCSALGEDEILRLQLSMRDWFRQME